jgi:hypothetical protein
MTPGNDDPEASEPVPRIEDILGHWFAVGEVHLVFREPDGRQFFLTKDTRERVHGTFLDAGQTWGRREEPSPLRGDAREQVKVRAFHEAGHAVGCVDEGVKVEYVTIFSGTGWGGESFLGYCQYDYHLTDALRQRCPTWAERVARADLSGPVADCLFRERKGLDVPEDVRYAWGNDFGKARSRLANKGVDPDQELDRLLRAVTARFQEAWVWDAVSRVAERLCDEGAIPGQVVEELVRQATAGHG